MHNFRQHVALITIGVAALLSWFGLMAELQQALVPPLRIFA